MVWPSNNVECSYNNHWNNMKSIPYSISIQACIPSTPGQVVSCSTTQSWEYCQGDMWHWQSDSDMRHVCSGVWCVKWAVAVKCNWAIYILCIELQCGHTTTGTSITQRSIRCDLREYSKRGIKARYVHFSYLIGGSTQCFTSLWLCNHHAVDITYCRRGM